VDTTNSNLVFRLSSFSSPPCLCRPLPPYTYACTRSSHPPYPTSTRGPSLPPACLLPRDYNMTPEPRSAKRKTAGARLRRAYCQTLLTDFYQRINVRLLLLFLTSIERRLLRLWFLTRRPLNREGIAVKRFS
jgi:hypothetical protein